MKRIVLFMVIVFVVSVGMASAESIYSPITVYNMSVTGTAKKQSATYSGVSWFPVVNLNDVKPNMGIFSIQVNQATLNEGTLNGTSSGTTYYLYYTVSNKDSANLWAGSGVTSICGPMPLSGATPVVQQFYPEFAQFLKVGVLASGVTGFATFKANLVIQ